MTTFNTYKPSNKFNPVGLIVLFAVVLFGGFIIYWVYEFIESWMPLIYLNIVMAVLSGFGIGALGAMVVKKFKIRAPMIAAIVATVAVLFATVGRWATYCSRDFDKHYRDGFTEVELWSNVNTNNEKFDQSLQLMYVLFQQASTSDAMQQFGVNEDEDSYFSKILFDKDKAQDDFKKLIGGSYEEFKKNILDCKNYYDLLTRYCGMIEPTTMELALHPGRLLDYVKMVNEQGRWNIKSHRYSWNDTADSEPVKGFFLWMVWLGELLALTAPAIGLVYSKANDPFVENEGDWAIEDKNAPNFLFEGPYNGQGNANAMIKNDIMKNPEHLFAYKPIGVIARIPEIYLKVTYKRSNYFDENYVTISHSTLVNARKNQRNNVEIIKNMRVDANFIATLYGMFEQTVPVMCHGENRAKDFQQQNEAREQAIASGMPLSPQRPKATGAEAIFDQPTMYNQAKQQYAQSASPEVPSYMRPAPDPHSLQPVEPVKVDNITLPEEPSFAQQELEQEKRSSNNHGDMDGLDTSNLDLDNFDFSKMK